MVDAEPIRLETMVYYAVNKPKGYVSTNFDPSGRPRVVDLLPEIPERVYTVGRLDEDSTGLMILTNDGELANKLAHPRYGVEKIYRALVAGLPGPAMLAKLTEGIWLSDGKVRAKRARIVGRQGQATQLELVLAEGKKREIRRMLSKLGHKVMSLTRIAMGPVTLKGLPTGNCRPLSRHEVDLLRKVASGIAISTPRSFEGDRSDRPRTSHSHGANRPRREQADRSPAQKGSVRHGPGPRRFRDNAAPAGAKSGHSQQRYTPPPKHAPGADQSGPRKKRTVGSAGGPPGQAGGSKRPAVSVPPATQPPRSRRIIGLEPEPPAGGRQGSKGRSIHKRPPARKPPLRRPAQRPLRASPNRVDESEGEDG
jgi:23S rRNA pseudouridine2605 synthase